MLEFLQISQLSELVTVRHFLAGRTNAEGYNTPELLWTYSLATTTLFYLNLGNIFTFSAKIFDT